jgi:predicted RNA binding protein YcfA (HicA-like mRNA interferase family)
MTYAELTRRLGRLGIEFRRQARGSHEIWWHPRRKLYTVIPNHPGKEIRKATLSKILRDLRLTEGDLRNA